LEQHVVVEATRKKEPPHFMRKRIIPVSRWSSMGPRLPPQDDCDSF